MTPAPALLLGLGLFAILSLIACGKKSETDLAFPESRVESGPVEDQFGEGFGKAYRADPNSEPANVTDNEMVPVSLTAEPVVID